jgi:GH15 family glucan-1,4-alpha-glucosidase
MAYLPIEDHGVIGDLHTAALSGIEGTVDWLCLPRFDARSVFAPQRVHDLREVFNALR